jgi:mRNA interferase RelE/StbE
MFEVILSPEAQAFFAAADKVLARKLARCFIQLEHEPRRHNNIKRLSGKLQVFFGTGSGTGACFTGSTKQRVMCWC